MKVSPILAIILALASLTIPACHPREEPQTPEEQQREPRFVVLTSPVAKDVTLSRHYVCQINSQRHVEVRAPIDGFLEEIPVKEGQAVKKGDLLFKIIPNSNRGKSADFEPRARDRNNGNQFVSDKTVSQAAAAPHQVKVANVEANAVVVRAPFDGILDRLNEHQGSLIKERDVLTSLTDNSTMCAYFNVPEARYLEFMARQGRPNEGQEIKLVLANGAEFSHKGNLSAIEARFNVETGNIPFRADFPNPDGLLRHGQTGNILVRRTLHNVMVIPQRAVFDVLDKHYVWVVGDDDVAHRHEIQIQEEADESFVVKSGIGVEHKIVLEGGRLLGEGSKVDSTFRKQE